MPETSLEIAAPAGSALVSPSSLQINADVSREEWNRYLAGNPEASLYHLHDWQAINADSLSCAPYMLGARREGRLVGVLPLTLVVSPWFGRILCSMPFVNYGGPCGDDEVIEDALVGEALALTRKLRADRLELRTRRPLTRDLQVSLRKVSLTLDLASDPEVLWNGFASKHRTNIRRAQKNELTVESGGANFLDTFYSLMEQGWRDLGTPLYRKSYFAQILAAFPDATRIFICYCKGEPIAAAFNGYFNGVAEGMWAAGGPRARALQANYVLYWEMMRDACVRGCHCYHLGRSTADSGAEDFKKKWNARSEQLYWYHHRPDGGAVPELNVDNPKYQRAIAIWRRLPFWVTRQVGPLVARSIP